jgi:hypothetical protein
MLRAARERASPKSGARPSGKIAASSCGDLHPRRSSIGERAMTPRPICPGVARSTPAGLSARGQQTVARTATRKPLRALDVPSIETLPWRRALGSGPGGVLGRYREQNSCGCMRYDLLGRCRSLSKQLFHTDWQAAGSTALGILRRPWHRCRPRNG